MPQAVINPPHSDEVDELLAQMPGWPLRWGISLMFGIVLLLLCLAWFIKYPDVIKGKITITTNTPPATVVARAGGPIHLLAADKTLLAANDDFATIGGTAHYDDVLTLRRALDSFQAAFDTDQLPAGLLLIDPFPARRPGTGRASGPLQRPAAALERMAGTGRARLQQSATERNCE